MNHPFDLLADLVDGTLGADDRARVEAHLDGCASCRADLAAATAGRQEVRALPEVPPPADLYRRVVTQAGGGSAVGRRPPTWYRWAGVAAAAALVGAIALALPEIGSEPGEDAGRQLVAEDAAAPAEAGGAETLAGPDVPLEVQSQNYDDPDLQRLADEAGRQRASAVSTDAAAFQGSDAAARCIQTAATGLATGRLAKLILARFEGRAAYIGVFLEGPVDGPPDIGVVWVAAKDDCSKLLSSAAAAI